MSAIYLEDKDDNDTFINNLIYLSTLPKKGVPTISKAKRILMLPLAIVYWFLLVLVFSIFSGLIIVSLGIGMILSDTEPTGIGYLFVSAPITFPVIWWIRYFKFGEYGSVM